MIRIEILVANHDEADAVISAIGNAEENGELNFPFGTKRVDGVVHDE